MMSVSLEIPKDYFLVKLKRFLMDRRTFLGWVGIGAIASSLPVAIAACVNAKEGSSVATPVPSTTASSVSTATTEGTTMAQAGGFVVVGTVSELNKDGKIFKKESPIGPVLVVNPNNNLVAVNPTCTHKDCTVKWEAKDQKFDCPCHDAEFSLDGSVKDGPAKKPLKVYTAKIEGDSVLVRA
jgi:cytochrome b6-f complex iron-sulfur subunit